MQCLFSVVVLQRINLPENAFVQSYTLRVYKLDLFTANHQVTIPESTPTRHQLRQWCAAS